VASQADRGPGSSTRDTLLTEASLLFRERGFHGTSVGDVLDRAGVQKGSLYHHFPSKEELAHAVIDRWVEKLRARVLDPLAAADGRRAIERVTSTLDGFLAEQTEAHGRGGCPFGNLAAEMADVHEGFRARLVDAFRRMAEGFAAQVARAQEEGDLRRDVDAAALGCFLVAALEGGILLAKVHRSCEPLATTLGCVKAHLASLRTTA
jgi:TetR/AcrR family transcriptional regulator, transcriptional repressor for nem operon